MRSFIVVSLILLASEAVAAPRTRLPPINDDEAPGPCHTILERVNAPGLPQQLAGRIELASCVADQAIFPIELSDERESVAIIEELVGPAFHLLDQVMAAGGAATKIAALRVKADIYTRMGARMMATVTVPTNMSGKAAEQYDTRRRIVRELIEPWQDHGRVTHERIVVIARAHPELQRNKVVQLAINDSERKLATPIATR